MAARPAVTDFVDRWWQTDSGLPHNHVTAITQSHTGYLWVGGECGLARFDGMRFIPFGLRDGMLSLYVLALAEDKSGTLWIGTRDTGLLRLRNGVFSKFAIGPGPSPTSVSHLVEDAKGRVWVGSARGVSYIEQDEIHNIPSPPGLKRNDVRTMLWDHSGALHVVFGDGSYWRMVDGQWQPAKGPDLESSTLGVLCEDGAGRIWGGASGNIVYCRTGEKWNQYSLSDKGISVNWIVSSPDGTVWAGMDKGGLYAFRNGGFEQVKLVDGGYAQSIGELFVDRDDNLWVGTFSGGLARLRRPQVEAFTLPASSGAGIVTMMAEVAPDKLWVGTLGDGIFEWDHGTGALLPPEMDLEAEPYGNTFFRSPDGDLWLGTGHSLNRFHQGQPVELAFNSKFGHGSVRAICGRGAGGMWIGSDVGLWYLIGETLTRQELPMKIPTITSLAEEPDGTLWIGSRNGLFRKRGEEFRRFGFSDGLASETILALLLEPDGPLWAGTLGGGVALRKGDGFVKWTSHEGLPDDTVSQVYRDDQKRLWLGTNRGLACVDGPEAAAMCGGDPALLHPIVFGRSAGMLSETCIRQAVTRLSDGRLCFGTARGFIRIDPYALPARRQPPAVLIEETLVDGQMPHQRNGTLPILLPPSSLTIGPGRHRVEIHYTGLDFGAPEKLRFRYRLAGVDRNWEDAGTNRVASYAQVATGTYRFEVEASRGDGIWSPVAAALPVRVLPHFWQTGWFFVSGVLVTLGLGAVVARTLERRKVQRALARLELQRAVENERARIARDLHDDLGASLTQIGLFSELARSDLAKPQQAEGHISRVFQIARSSARALDEIIWSANPANDTLENFILYLCDFAEDYLRAAGVRCRLDLPDTLPEAPLSGPARHHLYLTTKEALHNILKHANATEVHLRLVLEPGYFRLIVEDNGCGFNEATPGPDADGLGNMRRRLQSVGGRLIRSSVPAGGASVEMLVPLDSSAQFPPTS